MTTFRSIAVVTTLVMLLFVGCTERDGAAERAGERIDETIEEAGDAIEDAGDEIEDTLDQ